MGKGGTSTSGARCEEAIDGDSDSEEHTSSNLSQSGVSRSSHVTLKGASTDVPAAPTGTNRNLEASATRVADVAASEPRSKASTAQVAEATAADKTVEAPATRVADVAASKPLSDESSTTPEAPFTLKTPKSIVYVGQEGGYTLLKDRNCIAYKRHH